MSMSVRKAGKKTKRHKACPVLPSLRGFSFRLSVRERDGAGERSPENHKGRYGCQGKRRRTADRAGNRRLRSGRTADGKGEEEPRREAAATDHGDGLVGIFSGAKRHRRSV